MQAFNGLKTVRGPAAESARMSLDDAVIHPVPAPAEMQSLAADGDDQPVYEDPAAAKDEGAAAKAVASRDPSIKCSNAAAAGRAAAAAADKGDSSSTCSFSIASGSGAGGGPTSATTLADRVSLNSEKEVCTVQYSCSYRMQNLLL